MCIVASRRLGQRLLDHASTHVALGPVRQPLERAQTLDRRGGVVILATLDDEVTTEQMRVAQSDEHSIGVALGVQLDEGEAARCPVGFARQTNVLDLGVRAARSA